MVIYHLIECFMILYISRCYYLFSFIFPKVSSKEYFRSSSFVDFFLLLLSALASIQRMDTKESSWYGATNYKISVVDGFHSGSSVPLLCPVCIPSHFQVPSVWTEFRNSWLVYVSKVTYVWLVTNCNFFSSLHFTPELVRKMTSWSMAGFVYFLTAFLQLKYVGEYNLWFGLELMNCQVYAKSYNFIILAPKYKCIYKTFDGWKIFYFCLIGLMLRCCSNYANA